MNILALDLATSTGIALGPAGATPISYVERLKTKDDDPERAFKRLGIKLRDIFTADMPDLVVVEAPMNVGALIDWNDWDDADGKRRPKMRSNPATIYLLTGLVAATFAICGPYGIPCRKVQVRKWRKHFCGNYAGQDPKAATVARCHLLGLMPRDCRDDNRADAIGIHFFASDEFGKPATRQIFEKIAARQ